MGQKSDQPTEGALMIDTQDWERKVREDHTKSDEAMSRQAMMSLLEWSTAQGAWSFRILSVRSGKMATRLLSEARSTCEEHVMAFRTSRSVSVVAAKHVCLGGWHPRRRSARLSQT